MKKFIAAFFMLLAGAPAADASGLYLSLGYSRPDVGFSARGPIPGADSVCGEQGVDLSFCWIYDFSDSDEGATFIPNWPDSDIANNTMAWEDYTMATYGFKPRTQASYIYAIGWGFRGTPFRVEIEQSKTSFDSDGYRLTAPQGCLGGNGNTSNCDSNGSNIDPSPDYLTFDLNGYRGGFLSASATSLMVNTYFTLPYLDNIDPYIGVGIGKTKVDFTLNGASGGTNDENAVQFMIGAEYWVPNTGWYVGLEYRQSKISGAPERDDGEAVHLNFDHKAIVFKLRYDFITDDGY